MKYLTIYLNDHLAGSCGAIALINRMNREHPQVALNDLADDIRFDQSELRVLLRDIYGKENVVKQIGALVAERITRLKMNGKFRDASPLTRVIELETLELGITGKLLLWQNLRALDPAVSPVLTKLDELEDRANKQLRAIRSLQEFAFQKCVEPNARKSNRKTVRRLFRRFAA